MSRDVRELILSRMLIICSDIDDVVAAYRNQDQIDEKLRPAIQIFDGPETTRIPETNVGQQQYVPKRGAGPNLIAMTPSLSILLGAEAENVGPDLDALRMAVLKTVLTDKVLLGLVGPSGLILYDGCDMDVRNGRTMEGNMSISFSFVYPLLPQDF